MLIMPPTLVIAIGGCRNEGVCIHYVLLFSQSSKELLDRQDNTYNENQDQSNTSTAQQYPHEPADNSEDAHTEHHESNETARTSETAMINPKLEYTKKQQKTDGTRKPRQLAR